MTDLVIAVAAGAAGAYALSRQGVASSLPGVAIAIALVPPLSVVGIAAQRGRWDQAAGTLLLFSTNVVAILLVGGVVFVLTGVAPLRRARTGQRRVMVGLVAALVVGVLVVLALVVNGRQIAADALAENDVRRSVAQWLGPDTEFSLVSLQVQPDTAVVVLAGPGAPPPADDLARRIDSELGRTVTLDLQWVPRQRIVTRGPR